MTANEIRRRLAHGEKAIDLAIEKWEKNVAILRGKSRAKLSDGFASCALCMEDNRFIGGECVGCPVAKVASPGCDGTPYWSFTDAIDNDDNNDALRAAKAEVSFLKAVRQLKGRQWLKAHGY